MSVKAVLEPTPKNSNKKGWRSFGEAIKSFMGKNGGKEL